MADATRYEITIFVQSSYSIMASEGSSIDYRHTPFYPFEFSGLIPTCSIPKLHLFQTPLSLPCSITHFVTSRSMTRYSTKWMRETLKFRRVEDVIAILRPKGTP
jgi:hypothetical protein